MPAPPDSWSGTGAAVDRVAVLVAGDQIVAAPAAEPVIEAVAAGEVVVAGGAVQAGRVMSPTQACTWAAQVTRTPRDPQPLGGGYHREPRNVRERSGHRTGDGHLGATTRWIALRPWGRSARQR